MAEKDPLSFILLLTNILGHFSAAYDRSTQQYQISTKRWLSLLVNGVFHLVTNAFYLWYVTRTLDAGIKMHGQIYELIEILDSQLCILWIYIMMTNGLVKSKTFLQLLNERQRVRQKIRRQFGELQYGKMRQLLHLWIAMNVLYSVIFSMMYQVVMCVQEGACIYMIVAGILEIDAVVSFTFVIQFNAFLITLRAEHKFVAECIERTLSQKGDIHIQMEMYFELLSVMQLLMKAYALPIMYCIMLTFFEGTVQLYLLFHLISIVQDEDNCVATIMNNVIAYTIRLCPVVTMFLITMSLAGSTSNRVSLLY